MKDKMKKVFFLIVVLCILFIFYFFEGFRFLSLDYIQNEFESWKGFVQERWLSSAIIFFVVYVSATALSFPGATLLTLLAGALFGIVWGVVIVSFASTLGATFAFLGTRYLFRDFVERRFGVFIQRMNQGLKTDGELFVLSLRLIPVVPFFVVNAVFGLTQISTLKFFFYSQLGMIPGTFLYVNAGQELGKLRSLNGLLSPSVLISLTLLGIFPWLVRFGVLVMRNWQTYRLFPRPKSYDYNLIVIGAGAGGLVTSFIAAALKSKVLLIEKHLMGGDCLNYGCVPSKALLRSASAIHNIRHAGKFGIEVSEPKINFEKIMGRVQSVIKKIAPHDSVERYTKMGVDCISGEAILRSPFEVEVNGKKITTKNVVLATGAEPFIPQIPGLEETNVLTSETLWKLKELPRKLLVVGGGAMGCELAQAFGRLGSQVILVERSCFLLPRGDTEASAFIQKVFAEEHVQVLLSSEVISVSSNIATIRSASTEMTVEFDKILFAIGRKARTQGFGLEQLGIELTDQKTIQHDEFLATRFPNIFVCGDCAGPYQLTHVAAHQAWYAAINALFSPFKKFKQDLRVIPSVIFTSPQIAQVGLTEAEAKDKKIEFQMHRYDLQDLDRAICDGDPRGFVKILVQAETGQIIGATIVSQNSGESISEIVLAMKHRIGIGKILETIHAYPTWAEANKYVAGKWKSANAPQLALKILEEFHSWRRG